MRKRYLVCCATSSGRRARHDDLASPSCDANAILIPMTKVQTTYPLSRKLTDEDSASLVRVHSVYGILAVRPQRSLEELWMEYDASRLTPLDLTATLRTHGLPIIAPI